MADSSTRWNKADPGDGRLRMSRHHGHSNRQVKVGRCPSSSAEERYQIHSLLKAKQPMSEIALSLGRSRSTISRELSRGCGQRGYRAEQDCAKASKRAQRHNARHVNSKVWSDVDLYLVIQWSPEQIPGKVAVSHESVYLQVYANKAAGGDLHKNLRSQKPRRKRHLCGRDRRG